MIPYGRQSIDEDDIAEVVRVLRSDYLTTGPEVEAFEQALGEVCGVQHVVAVANGTAALHCAYAAAGLGPGKRLITTPLTFSATANAALALGAEVEFCDIDDATLCLDPKHVGHADVIAPVDFAGRLADIAAFMALGPIIVEDAAHALGTKGIGRAHLTTLSFHPVKTITTGEGGAVLSNDAELAKRAREFRNHGMLRQSQWAYDIESLGLNYRLSALQCALGRSQLRKLPQFVRRRADIVSRYDAAFAGLQARLPKPENDTAWHLYTLRVQHRAQIMEALQARGVGTQVHYLPTNGMQLYRQRGCDPQDTPIATRASADLLSLPLYPAMTDADVAHVITSVREVLA